MNTSQTKDIIIDNTNKSIAQGSVIILVGFYKKMNFSQSAQRTQRKEATKLGLILSYMPILSVNSVLSVRDIFFAFTQSLKSFTL